MRRLVSSSCLASALLSSGACTFHVDQEAHIERDAKRFDAAGITDVHLYTFDGAVDVRGWDRPEISIEIEKRGQDKEAVATIEVVADRTGSRVQVEARKAGSSRRIVTFSGFTSTSARLIASVPRHLNVVVRTGDGSIVADRLTGRLELRTDDGGIIVRETSGTVLAESGDGAIECDEVTGRIEARTNDGSVRIVGTPSVIRARSGDGAMVLRIRRGSTMAEDWMVATQDGSISVELPDDFNAEIDADAGSDGRARSEFTLLNATSSTRPARTLRGRLNEGGRTFILKTGDGSIRIARY
jgi:hypothetical protein